MTLTELPEWAWWAVALAGALVYVGVALVIALAVAGAISLRERAPRPVPIAIPAQRTSGRGRRRVPCAPGRPCGLHHEVICTAKACCDRHCPTAEAQS